MTADANIQSWRAIEALRAGVPNRDAVRALGSAQTAIEEQFRKQLNAAKDGCAKDVQPVGTLIAGDFGSGKSHLLEYLQHIALENNFVCSKVVVSKETPLYDPAKVYNAAIQSATVPDRVGSALVAIAGKLDFNSPGYADFYQWMNSPDCELSTRFAATVFVFERGQGKDSPEVSDRIIQFWSGARLAVAELRGWLKELGEAATYKIDKVAVKELALQRYRFVPRLIIAAGYAGWVVLVDEVELISRYSLRQRAKSYAELARLLGKLERYAMPGLTCVLAIVRDFESAVLEVKNDEEKVPNRLRGAGTDAELLMASEAERGMRVIKRDKIVLEQPTQSTIEDIYDKAKAMYASAYGWTPPDDHPTPDPTKRIRQHVKGWITDWDLRRLYPDYKPQIQTEELRQDYSEMPELAQESGDNPGDIAASQADL